MMFGFMISSVGLVEMIQSRKDVISDGLSWVRIYLFVRGGVGLVFFNFTDIKGDVHETYSTTIVKWLYDQIKIGA